MALYVGLLSGEVVCVLMPEGAVRAQTWHALRAALPPQATEVVGNTLHAEMEVSNNSARALSIALLVIMDAMTEEQLEMATPCLNNQWACQEHLRMLRT